MSILKKLFGKKDPVDEMRQCHARQDWAGVLRCAKQVAGGELDAALREEITAWEHQAGDALAAVNLGEGAWAQQSGNLLRAREDYQLALEQARSPSLREQAAQALAALERGELPKQTAMDQAGSGAVSHAGCSSGCASSATPVAAPQEADLDAEARLELLLATLPDDLAQRYLSAGPTFRKAWLAAQDGEETEALALFKQVPEAERNALFLFERGVLMARSGQVKEARRDLQAALTAEPELFPAFDVLADVLIAAGRIDELEKLLKRNLAEQRHVGHCWARLAELHTQRREAEPALAAGLKAIDEGIKDQALFQLCAQLLERAERFGEAESLLKRLPSGGCGGGIHPMLAEFWLRRGQQLDRALESFKGALRQERDNPRWLLRIAQVYLAKGWRKDAAEQIERLMRQGGLPEQLRAEVKAVADQLQKG